MLMIRNRKKKLDHRVPVGTVPTQKEGWQKKFSTEPPEDCSFVDQNFQGKTKPISDISF